MSNAVYEKVIYEDTTNKFYQLRLVLSDFREVEYFHIRKYFLSIDGEWIPSKEGVSVPANMDTIYLLLSGLVELVSESEIKHILEEFVKNEQDT